jgi:multiple RNA-binding domain-containing protein 1
LILKLSEYLKDHGVKLDTFKKDAARSDKIILVKNLPSGALPTELRFKFEKFGGLGRIIMPPSGLAALVEFNGSINAKRAFKAVAYSRFGDRPLYLEWAPSGSDFNKLRFSPIIARIRIFII